MEILRFIMSLPILIVMYGFVYALFYPAITVALAGTCASKVWDDGDGWWASIVMFIVVGVCGLLFGVVGGFVASFIMIAITFFIGGVNWIIGTYVVFCIGAIIMGTGQG